MTSTFEQEVRKAQIAIAAAEAGKDLLAQGFHDSGNAERLILLHGHELRYCHAFKKWLIYDRRRWAIDKTDQSRKLAKQTIVAFMEQAIEARNEPAEKFARLSLDSKRITNMLSMAECEAFVTSDQLDQDIWLLNFLNGTVDLRTGKLRRHDPGELITKLVHCEYRQDAECPIFLAALGRMMGAGPDASEAELERADRLVSYLQKALGYSLTGSTSEKVVFLCHGLGNNGKTTLLSTFLQILKEYSVLLQIDTLMVRQESSNSQADLADLRGARFVMTSETEEGQRLAEGKLKRITQGMGKIKACRKYENPVEFDETHKLWMDCNHKPIVRGTDAAIWNRLHPIPFTVTIPAAEIDPELPAKLLAESPGILAWAVAGSVRWCIERLGKAPEVTEAVREYREEMNQVGRFLAECCIILPTGTVKARQLYSAYRKWVEDAGEHSISEAIFAKRLADRGTEKSRTESGVAYRGVGLKTETSM
jgi:putative DNA primase/helicase